MAMLGQKMAGLRFPYGKVWIKNGIVAEFKSEYNYAGVKDGKLGNKMAELSWGQKWLS